MRKLHCHICDFCRVELQVYWSDTYTEDKGMYIIPVVSTVLELCKPCYDRLGEHFENMKNNEID